MEKIISIREVAAVKKMAQIVNPLVMKKANLLKKIAQLTEEIEGPAGLNAQISGMEAGIKAKYCGYGTEQLIKKVVSPAVRPDGTPVLDAKTGKQLTKTTWEPSALLKFDKEHNNYKLVIPEAEVPESKGAGSDFDADTEALEKEAEAQEAIEQQIADDENNPFNM